MSDQRHSATAGVQGADRRAFRRYAVRLPASIVLAGQGSRVCEIRDFCVGGLYLAYGAPAPGERQLIPTRGDIIDVSCGVPGNGGTIELHLRTRIMRTDGETAGVAFIDPEPSAIQTLQDYVLSQQHDEEPAEPPRPDAQTAQTIMAECHRLILDSTTPLVKSFHKRITDYLFNHARENKSVAEQNAYFDAISIFDRSAARLEAAFRETVERQLREGITRRDTPNKNDTTQSLSLVDDNAFDDWLAVTNIIDTVTSKHREILTEIERRLTTLTGNRIDGDNNPFGPALFGYALQDSLALLTLEPSASHASYSVAKATLCDELKGVFTKLDGLLKRHGLSADVKARISKSPEGPKQRKEPADEAVTEVRSPVDDPTAHPTPTQAEAASSHRPAAAGDQPAGSNRGSFHGSAMGSSGPAGASGVAAGTSGVATGGGAPGGGFIGNSGGTTAGGGGGAAGAIPASASSTSTQSINRATTPLDPASASLTPGVLTGAIHAGHAQGANVAAGHGGASAPGTGGASTPSPQSHSPAGHQPFADAAPLDGDTTPSLSTQDLYQLVHDLRQLRQTVAQQGTTGQAATTETVIPAAETSATGSSGIEMQPAVVQYSSGEIYNALTELQLAGTSGSDNRQAVKENLLTVLKTQSDGEPRQIGMREERIIDVAWNLFDSMFQDMLLADSVQRWLKRLEIPLLKLALIDDSLFLDKTHVARQVINQLAQLEMYGDEDAGQRAINTKINRVLDRIAKRPDIDAEVFSGALKELQNVVEIQNQAYTDNVRDVVVACEQEQHVINPDDSVPDAIDDGALAHLDNERRDWLRRVKRMPLGQWVLTEPKGKNPQRLRLAWVARNHSRYVFVNMLGLKEATYSPQELAQHLRTGNIVLLENADDPAMDRAQYNMLQDLHHQLVYETTHDQLTGLVNRREFEHRLDEALSSAQREDRGHVFCYFDVDQLSVINNTCGHAGGDRLLKDVAELLGRDLDATALLARIGSDEFGLLLADCDAAHARRIVERQLTALTEYRFVADDKRLAVNVGVGLVPVFAGSGKITDVLRAAETSCQIAKEKGPNHIQEFNADDSQWSRQQKIMRWVARIDEALDQGCLELRCQRIMPLKGNGSAVPHHAEILLGITDEDGNSISPQEFILAAEHYHRMPAIDRWVISTAFRWMADHPDELEKIGGFAINLSGRSLSDDGFQNFILEQMEQTGVPMERVCFEVTETAGIANLSNAAQFIIDMKRTGCHFSLDDFGSGMSSYAYLKNLPVDYLKIDGAFVKDMHNNANDYAVVKSITEIGHFMGKQIIAEYAENETILSKLRELGVDYAQGYAIEKPHSLNDLVH